MAFCGSIKLERWNWLFRPIDYMSRVVVSKVLGEEIFNYEHSWKTNNNIIGLLIGCLARVGVAKWEIIRLGLNIFDPS